MARAQHSFTRAAAEVPATIFVLDNGASSMKAGFASDEATTDAIHLESCEVIQNCLVRTRDKKTFVAAQCEAITQWSESVYRRPIENGQVVSWEAEKEIWDYSLFDEKTASKKAFIPAPAETTLILAETPNSMPALQKNTDEIIIEEFGFGGYMRVIGPSLNAYHDLHSSHQDAEEPNAQPNLLELPMECLLVIDSGYSYTTVTPCFKGKPIQRAIRRLDIGGKHLTNLLKETISVRHFDLHQDTKTVNDIKEDVAFVSQNLKADLDKTWKGNKQNKHISASSMMDVDQQENAELRIDYVLPDGVNLTRGYARPHDPSKAAEKRRKLAISQPDPTEIVMTLGNERFAVPEVIFNPADIGSKQPGLADCVIQSLSKLPPLIQATMLANITVVGGTSKIPGFVDRLRDELRAKITIEWPIHVHRMGDPVTSTWLGGARLACNHIDIVRQYAVSKGQYQEYGSTWTARKFSTLN